MPGESGPALVPGLTQESSPRTASGKQHFPPEQAQQRAFQKPESYPKIGLTLFRSESMVHRRNFVLQIHLPDVVAGVLRPSSLSKRASIRATCLAPTPQTV